jgi:hypothetical protein
LPLIVEVEVLVVKICWLVSSTEAVLVLWVLVEVLEVAVEDVSMVVAVKEEGAAYWDFIAIIHFVECPGESVLETVEVQVKRNYVVSEK